MRAPTPKTKPTLHYALSLVAWRPSTCVFPVLYDDKSQPLLKDYLRRASNDPAADPRLVPLLGKEDRQSAVVRDSSGAFRAGVCRRRHQGGQVRSRDIRIRWNCCTAGLRHSRALPRAAADIFGTRARRSSLSAAPTRTIPTSTSRSTSSAPVAGVPTAPVIVLPRSGRSLRRPAGSTRWRRRPRRGRRSTKSRLSSSICPATSPGQSIGCRKTRRCRSKAKAATIRWSRGSCRR